MRKIQKNKTNYLEPARALIISGLFMFIIKFTIIIGFGFVNYFLDGVVCFWVTAGIDTVVALLTAIVISKGIHNLIKETMKYKKGLRAAEILLLLIAPIKVAIFFISERVVAYFTKKPSSYWDWHLLLGNMTINLSDLILLAISFSCLSWGFFRLRKEEQWDVKPIYSVTLLMVMMVIEIAYFCLAVIYQTHFNDYNYDLIHAITAIIGIMVCLELVHRIKKMSNTRIKEFT